MRRAIAVLVLLSLAASAPTTAAAPSSMSGVISHMGSGYPTRYLALPVKPFLVVELCGPADCVILAQNDYGPDQRVHPDRIADVSAAMFERLCGCPASAGVMRGSWTVLGDNALPPTDTEK